MNIVDWAVSTMDALGPLGVFLLIFLENIFPPIPSEVILPLAGVTSAGPNQSFWLMLLASIAGSVVGAWLLYGIGRLLGPERLPKAARFAGVWIRRARSQWYSVKSELDRELAAEELKRSVREAQQSIADVGTQLRDAGTRVREGVEQARRETEDLVETARRMPGEPPRVQPSKKVAAHWDEDGNRIDS